MNERKHERLMAESYIAMKKMNNRDAKRFMLSVRNNGFTVASLLNDYNPVPYNACKRHINLASLLRTNDERWRWHMEMADYFLMLQKSN